MADTYACLIRELEDFGHVLTEHVADPSVIDHETATMTRRMNTVIYILPILTFLISKSVLFEGLHLFLLFFPV